MPAITDQFVVATAAVAAVKRKRQSHEPDVIKRYVAQARQVGADAATAAINRTLPAAQHVLSDTVRKWLSRWRSDCNFSEKVGKRGRPELLASVGNAKKKSLPPQIRPYG